MIFSSINMTSTLDITTFSGKNLHVNDLTAQTGQSPQNLYRYLMGKIEEAMKSNSSPEESSLVGFLEVHGIRHELFKELYSATYGNP